jgi:predicted DNA-binding transcriptional regulator YafY
MAQRGPRYAPAARLQEVRALVDSATGASIYDIAERFEVNPRTALRYIQALQRAGEPVYEEMSGKRKVGVSCRLPAARRSP